MTPHLKRASSVDYDKCVRPLLSSTPEVLESIAGLSALRQRYFKVLESIAGLSALRQRYFKEQPETNGSIRRCLSESQVLGQEGGSCSSVSSETSSSSGLVMGAPEVFPSLPDVVLQQLGLTAATRACDVLTEQDVESRFTALALAFKTDKLTLLSRHDRQQRQRDQAERNMTVEVAKLKAAVHNLNYLCKDSESIDILSKIQDQVDVLQRSTERVSSSAEIYGAVQQESRVSKVIDVMLLHVENLKRIYEKDHAELEETKRVLQENNIVMDGGVDGTDGAQLRSKRYNSLVTLVGTNKRNPITFVSATTFDPAAHGRWVVSTTKKGRRASIAAFARPLGSQDSLKSTSSNLTFGDIKSNFRTHPHNRRTSLSPTASHLDSPTPGWDRTDRLDRPEENATDLICRTHMAVLDSILPLNVDYVLRQTRRCATFLLLVAALWSLVSTFVPATAQTRDCYPFSWGGSGKITGSVPVKKVNAPTQGAEANDSSEEEKDMCTVCKKSFKNLAEHKYHTCPSDNSTIPSSIEDKLATEDISMQPQDKSQSEEFLCSICNKTFHVRSALTAHMLTHAENLGYHCDICNKSFAARNTFKKHMRSHKNGLCCDVCKKPFSHNSDLVRHLRTHTGDKPFICDVCKKSFSENGNLVKHLRTHAGERPFSCQVCKKTFSLNRDLMRHVRTHTGDRPFSCDICNKSFSENGNLMKHKRVHTGDRPYTCEVCGKTFSQKIHLVKHKRTHTGDRPYSCELCKKLFTENSSLIRHMRIHTGDRPYCCHVCGKSFTRNGTLKVHMCIHARESQTHFLE
ncbi:hypothetical protein C0J52_16541 [Blattella germanica]|nr:hypothetical protein C0J52_16541 [Blattella germanica]